MRQRRPVHVKEVGDLHTEMLLVPQSTEDGLKLFNTDGMMGDKNLNRF